MIDLTPEEREGLDRQLAEALEMEAKGIQPYVPDILFTEGVFKDRAEFDEWSRTSVAQAIPYEVARHKPAPKPRGRKSA